MFNKSSNDIFFFTFYWFDSVKVTTGVELSPCSAVDDVAVVEGAETRGTEAEEEVEGEEVEGVSVVCWGMWGMFVVMKISVLSWVFSA